jgi:hypothetical protein
MRGSDPGGRMWQLKMYPGGDPEHLVEIGSFETLAGVAIRIIEFEGYSTNGVYLEFDIDPNYSDEEALSVFFHKGNRAHYGVRRARAN